MTAFLPWKFFPLLFLSLGFQGDGDQDSEKEEDPASPASPSGRPSLWGHPFTHLQPPACVHGNVNMKESCLWALLEQVEKVLSGEAGSPGLRRASPSTSRTSRALAVKCNHIPLLPPPSHIYKRTETGIQWHLGLDMCSKMCDSGYYKTYWFRIFRNQ